MEQTLTAPRPASRRTATLRLDAGLSRLYNFDAADLEANRAGRLSADQALIFANTARVERTRGPRMIMLTVVLIAAAAAYAVASSGGRNVAPSTLAVLGIALIVPLTLVAWAARAGGRYRAALTSPTVYSTAGPVSCLPTGASGTWTIACGNVRFAVAAGDTEAFRDGGFYRIFFRDTGLKSPGILSVEPL